MELSKTSLEALLRPALATLLLSVLTPLFAFALARRLLGLKREEAAALAAHYGSVSAVTFLAALAFVQAAGHPAEGFMPTLVAFLEVPGVVIGLLLARARSGFREALREVLVGRSVFLLVGGLLVGFLSGEEGMQKVKAFFVDPFNGALTLFLMELGMVAARRLQDVARLGGRLLLFGTLVPLLHGVFGLLLARLSGLSLGGGVVLAAMAASASYIAAPAAVRLALPQVNPSLYIVASLAVTFPFNLVLGIPLYYALGVRLWNW